MAEFDEVGRTVEGFASEDATVVIGTVLDQDMQDEVRVTVFATGLNRAVQRQSVSGERADLGTAPARKHHEQTTQGQGDSHHALHNPQQRREEKGGVRYW